MSEPVPAPHHRGADEAGLRFIIIYKLLKGALTIASGIVIGGALAFGLGPRLQEHAARVHEHATGAWALHAAELFGKLTTPRWLRLSAVALELDGAVSWLEAWALKEGHAWGPWLVVVITALFLPAEVFELVRHPRLSRAVILVGNVAILVFLAWYARRHSARLVRRRAPPPPQA
jgi:uncharacterized membrane protein (DUF2068 family)